jgi:hypothetical protein
MDDKIKEKKGKAQLQQLYEDNIPSLMVGFSTIEKLFFNGSRYDYSCVDVSKLLELGDYATFKLVYEKYKPKKNSKRYFSKDQIEGKIHELIIEDKLSDYRFVNVIDFKNNESNKTSRLLEYFRIGKLDWNSKIVLKLINLGGVCFRLVEASEETGNVYELDFFTTKLLKEYCERNIEE